MFVFLLTPLCRVKGLLNGAKQTCIGHKTFCLMLIVALGDLEGANQSCGLSCFTWPHVPLGWMMTIRMSFSLFRASILYSLLNRDGWGIENIAESIKILWSKTNLRNSLHTEYWRMIKCDLKFLGFSIYRKNIHKMQANLLRCQLGTSNQELD